MFDTGQKAIGRIQFCCDFMLKKIVVIYALITTYNFIEGG